VIDVPDAPHAPWTADLDPARFAVLRNANGAVRLGVADGDGSVVQRAQPALDAARRAGAVNHFGFERRTLAEVFLDLVGHPADEETANETAMDDHWISAYECERVSASERAASSGLRGRGTQ
jgi:hypothetical protein